MSSEDTRQGEDRTSLSRRRYVQALVAAGIGGAAGCGGDGGATATPTEEATATPTDTPGATGPTATPDGETPETETATPTGTETATATPRGEPQSDTITVTINNVPQQSNFNLHTPAAQANGKLWFIEMAKAQRGDSGAWQLNATFDAPWIDGVEEITVPTVQKSVEVDPPFDTYVRMHPDLSYWDGTPIDAESRMNLEYIWYATGGGLFDSSATLNAEVVSEFEIHTWRNKGEVEGQEADPANFKVLRNNALWGNLQMHPDFYQPFIDSFKDASSQSRAEEITTNLESRRVSIFDWADNDWGSGLYRVESADDISSDRATGYLREDHPASEHATVPKFEARFTSADRTSILMNQGEIDVTGGLVKPEGGTLVRSSLPDYVQQIDSWLQAGGNDQMLFNWHNKHLRRLWVRRAIVTAIDWIQVGRNGWGAWMSTPDSTHVGMTPSTAKEFFSADFLEKLHTWPMQSDFETARQYMQNAGYTKTGGRWVGPDGDKISLRYVWPTSMRDWVGRVQTVSQNLRDFGIGVGLEGVNDPAFHKTLSPQNQNYDIAPLWGPGGSVLGCYFGQSGWWTDPLLGGEKGASGWSQIPENAEVDSQGKPMHVQIPTSVGSIQAPEQAGAAPDLKEAGISAREVDLAKTVWDLRRPGITEEEFQQKARLCAQYYNYYLPDFAFHQYAHGLVGNVRDFEFPPKESEACETTPQFVRPDLYQVRGGVAQLKYDDDYPEPQSF